jgi:hypothetical protein
MTRSGLLLCVVFCAALGGACGGSPSSPSSAELSTGGPLAMTISPQDSSFARATEEYRRLWADEGSRIVDALQQGSGLTFVQSGITAVVYEGVSMSGNRDTPMRLRASYPPDTKRSALVHELGHRLIAQLATRPPDLDEHRILDLFLYDVWESLWGREFADRQVAVESGQRGLYDYESTWRWALSLSKAERAARFTAIVQANQR